MSYIVLHRKEVWIFSRVSSVSELKMEEPMLRSGEGFIHWHSGQHIAYLRSDSFPEGCPGAHVRYPDFKSEYYSTELVGTYWHPLARKQESAVGRDLPQVLPTPHLWLQGCFCWFTIHSPGASPEGKDCHLFSRL